MRISPPGEHPEVVAIQDRLTALGRLLSVGDLTPKRYAKERQDSLARLGRAMIVPSFERGESILAEHHWVEGHPRIPDSVLRETAQIASSLYATDRRLFRWRFQDRGVPTASFLEGVEEGLEDRRYSDVAAVHVRRARRWGEALTGAVIAGVGVLLAAHLRMTAYVLAAVGLFGVLHGILLPTRWVEITSREEGEAPWPVLAASAKSARALLAEVERRTRSERG